MDLRDYLIIVRLLTCTLQLRRCAGRSQYTVFSKANIMAQVLPPTRISQSLPIPKCSTCGQFVPLDELGDHICALSSPLPRQQPTATPAAVHALLPKRLQGRIPYQNGRGGPSRSASRSPPLSIDTSSSRSTRPQTDASTPSNTAQSMSAISRDTPTTARPSLTTSTARPSLARELPVTPRDISATARPTQSPISPPRSTPPGQPPQFPIQGRSGYRGPPRGISPSGIQSNIRNQRDTPSPQRLYLGTVGPGAGIPETHTPRQSLVPPPERGIDTKTGGEAGMAGVGRRGFAAVARAAMFVLPPDSGLGPQPQRDSNQSRYLDIDIDALSPRHGTSFCLIFFRYVLKRFRIR
jgi:hypothetical protein